MKLFFSLFSQNPIWKNVVEDTMLSFDDYHFPTLVEKHLLLQSEGSPSDTISTILKETTLSTPPIFEHLTFVQVFLVSFVFFSFLKWRIQHIKSL